MTVPQAAIEKAIEGGWKIGGLLDNPIPEWDYGFCHRGEAYERGILTVRWPRKEGSYSYRTMSREVYDKEITVDPSFWQCLGKTLAWKADEFSSDPLKAFPWKARAYRLYDLILTGADTGQLWGELLGSDRATNDV